MRDEHSRYLLELRDLANARSQTVRKNFERLFQQHGLPQAIRSDNGSPFASARSLLGLSRLSVWWVALGIDLEKRPALIIPKTTARMNACTLISVAKSKRLANLAKEALDLWRQSFNYERPHESLGMALPGGNSASPRHT